MKTTYYLRSRSATHVEKSTLKGTDGKLNAVSSTMPAPILPKRGRGLPDRRPDLRSLPVSPHSVRPRASRDPATGFRLRGNERRCRIDLRMQEIATMLDWSEPTTTKPALAAIPVTDDGHAAGRHATGLGAIERGAARVSCRRQGDDQLPRRRQSAPAAEIPLGLGEISRRLQQPLDADRSLDAGRHRALEIARRPDRRRAPLDQAQPRLLRRLGIASSPTTSCWRSTAISPIPNAGNICCVRPSKRRCTLTPSNTSSKASASTKASCSTCIARCRRSPTRRPGRSSTPSISTIPASRPARWRPIRRSCATSSPFMSCSKACGSTPASRRSCRSAAATRWSASPSSINTSCATNRSI